MTKSTKKQRDAHDVISSIIYHHFEQMGEELFTAVYHYIIDHFEQIKEQARAELTEQIRAELRAEIIGELRAKTPDETIH